MPGIGSDKITVPVSNIRKGDASNQGFFIPFIALSIRNKNRASAKYSRIIYTPGG